MTTNPIIQAEILASILARAGMCISELRQIENYGRVNALAAVRADALQALNYLETIRSSCRDDLAAMKSHYEGGDK